MALNFESFVNYKDYWEKLVALYQLLITYLVPSTMVWRQCDIWILNMLVSIRCTTVQQGRGQILELTFETYVKSDAYCDNILPNLFYWV